MQLKNKRVLILGLGISGRAAAEFLLQKEAIVYASDNNQKVLEHNPDVARLRSGGLLTFSLEDLPPINAFDLLVISPGVPLTHPLVILAKNQGIPLLGEVELACRFLSAKSILGITGTNGKTTVTLLVTHILNQAGYKALALGNVGTAMTSQCTQACDLVVAELSSYQLETMESQIIDAGVILNITPDHLDRYPSMKEYAQAKLKLADCIKPSGCLYIEENCYEEFGYLITNQKFKLYGYSNKCDLYPEKDHLVANKKIACMLPLSYQNRISHDLENMMAAYALCQEVGVTPEQFLAGLSTFKKPAHRIEFVCERKGVSYYDDSKGTNLDAVIRAVHTLDGDIILIAGGVDKGAAYTPWITAFGNKVRLICAIGQAAKKIETDLAHAYPVVILDSLEAAVRYAASQAQPGENVLLSPGCSSFDMFRDYAHRGEEFQRIVRGEK